MTHTRVYVCVFVCVWYSALLHIFTIGYFCFLPCPLSADLRFRSLLIRPYKRFLPPLMAYLLNADGNVSVFLFFITSQAEHLHHVKFHCQVVTGDFLRHFLPQQVRPLPKKRSFSFTFCFNN